MIQTPTTLISANVSRACGFALALLAALALAPAVRAQVASVPQQTQRNSRNRGTK